MLEIPKSLNSNPDPPLTSRCPEDSCTEGSPHPTNKSSPPNPNKTFEDLLEEDFHYPCKENPSEALKTPLALYTFTKDSLTNPHQRLNLDSILTTPKPNTEFASPKFLTNTEVKSHSIKALSQCSHFFSDSNQIEELKKNVENLQRVIIKKDKNMRKIVEEYENKIRELESYNFSLMKQLNSLKRESGRPKSFSSNSGVVHKKAASSGGTGKNEVVYPNGVRSEVFENGYKVTYYPNGDVKQEHPDGVCVYYFASQQVTKTSFRNGIQVLKFKNGQTEKIFPDGTQEIKFADGTFRCVFPSGESETMYPNKTIEKVDRNGIKTRIHKNGYKETLHPLN